LSVFNVKTCKMGPV